MKKPQNRKSEPAPAGERIAKVMARAGLCSRRDAETWIAAGRVGVNGRIITSPALNIGRDDRVTVDGAPLPTRERTRLFLYHKDRGLVTSHRDPEGRPTIFERLPKDVPRLVSVGRLDFNTEGLLLLTNDGGLARVLELPATGWLRRYRVRALGSITQPELDALRKGVTVDGVAYGSIEATLDRLQGANAWITFAIREGKNREVRNVLRHLGLQVNRLIRISFGPFQLGELKVGGVEEVRSRVLRDQLGDRIVEESGADFAAPLVQRDVEIEEARPTPRDRHEQRGDRHSRSEGSKAPPADEKRGAKPSGPQSRDGKSRAEQRGEKSRADDRRPAKPHRGKVRQEKSRDGKPRDDKPLQEKSPRVKQRAQKSPRRRPRRAMDR